MREFAEKRIGNMSRGHFAFECSAYILMLMFLVRKSACSMIDVDELEIMQNAKRTSNVAAHEHINFENKKNIRNIYSTFLSEFARALCSSYCV